MMRRQSSNKFKKKKIPVDADISNANTAVSGHVYDMALVSCMGRTFQTFNKNKNNKYTSFVTYVIVNKQNSTPVSL
jgi:hypothetical protein